jgi:hypothetical protein
MSIENESLIGRPFIWGVESDFHEIDDMHCRIPLSPIIGLFWHILM